MRKFIMSLVVLGFLTAPVLMLQGCNHDTPIVYEEGEVLEVNQTVITDCDIPFTFKVRSVDPDTSVETKYLDAESEYEHEYGMNIQYDITTPCTVVTPEFCGVGTVFDENTSTCIVEDCEVNLISCGDDTVLDEDTQKCEVVEDYCSDEPEVPTVPPVVGCGEDFTLIGDACFPDAYIPAYVPPNGFTDCIKGYTWDEDKEVCNLGGASVDPVPEPK